MTRTTTPVLMDEVRRVLDTIEDPCSVAASVPMGLHEMGLIKAVEIDATGNVSVDLRLTSPFCEMIAYMRNEAIARIGGLPGVKSVSVTHDTGLDWDHDMIAPEAQARRQKRLAALQEIHRRK
jgi:metal-sulfur cluster biosynthetic enzyme